MSKFWKFGLKRASLIFTDFVNIEVKMSQIRPMREKFATFNLKQAT